jgi:hypothetical protein
LNVTVGEEMYKQWKHARLKATKIVKAEKN